MSFDALMGVTQRLIASAEALAVLAAYIRVRLENLEPDPEILTLFRAVMTGLGVDPADIESIPAPQLEAVQGTIRSFLVQAQILIDQPDRPPGWTVDDPGLMQNQGQSSMMVAGVIAAVAPGLGELDYRLRAPGARFLDIGTGVGLLAVAMCRTFPALSVTGIDLWPPALDLARRNVSDAGLADRIELREQSITEINDQAVYEGAWMPAIFLPRSIIATALELTRSALKAGGWCVLGLYAAPPEPLPQALNALRIVRSGGHPWTPQEAVQLLDDAGFTDVQDVERTWTAPIRIVVGRAA